MVKKVSSKQLYLDTKKRFSSVNYIDECEAMILVCHICKLKKEQVLIDDVLVDETLKLTLIELVNKRISHYPLQYILGEWEFYGNTFLVGEGVLIPRQDTETLVDVSLASLKDVKSPKILDLCSGSGCVGISLAKALKKQNPTVILLEKSKIALDYSNKNAKLNGVSCTVVEDDVLAPITSHSEFDIIVSNPPYLTRKDMESLQSEVAFEPEMALYGLQNDGLLFYEKIVQNFTDRLKVGGIMAFEVGISQAPAVENIFLKNGYNSICHKEDLCGIIRIVFACK